jgi:hypothetical protein
VYNGVILKNERNSAMLFRKKMPRSCSYCVHSTALDEERMLCIKKGVVELTNKCRSFSYDPCKRVPSKAKALDFEKYDKEDYTL